MTELNKLSKKILDQIIKSLTSSKNKETALERQQILLRLIKRLDENPSDINYDSDLLIFCEGAEFFQIAGYLYLKKKNYPKVISCYLKDDELKSSLFQFIQSLMESNSLSEEDKNKIKTSTFKHLPDLVKINSDATSRLVIKSFSRDYEQILKELEQYPQVQFFYLKSIMNRDTSSGELLQNSGISITPQIQERYIKLMCEYSRETVYSYLQSEQNYPLDACLKLVQQAKIYDATAYLLERTGDVIGALKSTLEIVNKQIEEIIKFYDGFPQEEIESSEEFELEKKLSNTLRSCIELCQRNSKRLDDQENEQLWNALLVTFIEPLIKSRSQNSDSNQKKAADSLTKFINQILHGMTGHVTLTSLLKKILNEHKNDSFGDFKLVILAMLDTYSFEKNILEITRRLVEQDMYTLSADLHHKLSKAYRTKVKFCGNCQTSFLGNKEKITVFLCGHTFHQKCLEKRDDIVCPLCFRVKQKKHKKKDSLNITQ